MIVSLFAFAGLLLPLSLGFVNKFSFKRAPVMSLVSIALVCGLGGSIGRNLGIRVT